jgi:hypothetical protein
MPDTPITFENVEVIRDGSMGFWCRCQDQEVFIGSNVPLQGTTVRIAGDHGTLVLPRWFVRDHGLREP